MTPENRDILLQLLDRHRALGISEQIDYDKFYLYSIIVHSTAIEGSTVTEVEAQLLFDEGITSSKRTMLEQQMNLLQMEFGVLPTKVLIEDKVTYIQALIDTREAEDITIFQNCMANLHIQHLKADIDQYLNSTADTTQKNETTTQKRLSAIQKAILDYLKDHPKATRQEVAEALGNITEDGIKYHFSRLQKMGYLKRESGRKLGWWVVLD